MSIPLDSKPTETKPTSIDSGKAASVSSIPHQQSLVSKSTIDRKDAFDFHVREHASLRREIELDKQEMRRLEVYAVIGTGLVWSWIVTSSNPVPEYAWFIPMLFSILGLLKTQGLIKSILIKAAYLRELEKAVSKFELLQGWENYIEEHRGEYPSWLNWLFWLLLISVTIIVPILVLVKG